MRHSGAWDSGMSIGRRASLSTARRAARASGFRATDAVARTDARRSAAAARLRGDFFDMGTPSML